MKTPALSIAREGYPFILFTGFCTLVLALLDNCMAYPALMATAFVVWFFRDPERITPAGPGLLICPADGKVIRLEKVRDERFSGEETMKLSIFMNVFNVHVNRSPFQGTVKSIRLKPGSFFAADKDKAVLHNEYCAMTLHHPSGWLVPVVQVAGLIARRIICWAEPGDTLAAGQRYGLIRFGSRVDLYLPLDMQVDVRIGQKVRAGETVLGSFPPEPRGME